MALETLLFGCAQLVPIAIFALCAAACTSVLPNVLPPTSEKHDFSIELYEPEAVVDLKRAEDGTQPGLQQMSGVEPVDVLTDGELLGVDWASGVFEYGSDVRDRYGDSTGIFIPDMQFVANWDGQPVFGGWLVVVFAARTIDLPVLKYDPFQRCKGGRVVLTLTPNSWGDIGATYPGLGAEMESNWREYFDARPLACVSSP